MSEQPTPNFSTIPERLRAANRWLVWTLDGNGKKAPRSITNPAKNTRPNRPENWTDFEKAADVAKKNGIGIGFALGHVQDGPTYSGIDLDKCRDPNSGRIEEWALRIIRVFDSYTEVSPSGTGVKIFITGSLPPGSKQGKVFKMEMYDQDRYFTVTGEHLEGTPEEVMDRGELFRSVHAEVWSSDLFKLVRVFGFYLSGELKDDWIYIRCPWEDHHSGKNQPQDAGLHVTSGKVDGFKCLHSGCSEKHLGEVRAMFGISGANVHDFIVDHNGNIVKDNQENIRRALTLLEVKLQHNVFENKTYLSGSAGQVRVLDDQALKRTYLVIDDQFRFRPSFEFFTMVVEDMARQNSFHPVVDYLNQLTWDGTPRIDAFLHRYGSAEDSELFRVISGKIFIAAVRRIRQPGVKFDEMLVLESPQGFQKSTAILALCPDESWFSDDLPLNVDAKQIIERTAGKWIIEAGEMAGMRKSEIDQLKSSLSRTVDGPVRLAYGRIPEERPRSFIVIGTTNNAAYLKDMTGNRRFWPVRVGVFDIAGIRRDRDQLWAEAAHREAMGESIRLDPKYYEEMGTHQESRRITDPWEDVLLDSDIDWTVGRVPVADIWTALGVHNFHDSRQADRIYLIMQKMGYPVKRRAKFKGRTVHCWIRADEAKLMGWTLEAETGPPDFAKPEDACE